jgi:hypothetical protein
MALGMTPASSDKPSPSLLFLGPPCVKTQGRCSSAHGMEEMQSDFTPWMHSLSDIRGLNSSVLELGAGS